MKLTPLVMHAAVHIPRYTAAFSATLPVATIDVVSGGNTVLNCSAPHGVPIGRKIGASIIDAESPNQIVAASVLSDGEVLLTTAYQHDLTTTPDPKRFQAWNTVCRLAGFASDHLNGQRQLVEVRSATQFVVRPGGVVASIALGGAEKLLERIELGLIGWHAMEAQSSTALKFTTPAAVSRSYTISSPVVARNIKVFGARDHESAYHQYTQDGANLNPSEAAMFVCPETSVIAERSGNARGSVVADIGPGVDYRQRLADGFSVVIFLPSAGTAGHVACIDLARSEIFRAVLRTFYGLRLPRPELVDGGNYAAVFHAHGSAALTNKAVYAHRYDFQLPAYLTNADAIAPWDWTGTEGADGAVDSVVPIGAPALRDLDFTGILHDGMPQPLLANIRVE